MSKPRSRQMTDSRGVCQMKVEMPYHNKTTKGKHAIGLKTEYLIHEGKTPEQAYAIANSMSREGRLTPEGHYIRKGKRRG